MPLPLFKLLAICFHLSALLKNWKNTFFNFYSNLIMQWRKREPQLRRNSQVDIFPFWIWDTKLTKHLSLSLFPHYPVYSLYTGRLWYHMYICQRTVGLIILSLYIFFIAPKAYSTVGWQLHLWYHSLPVYKEFPALSIKKHILSFFYLPALRAIFMIFFPWCFWEQI